MNITTLSVVILLATFVVSVNGKTFCDSYADRKQFFGKEPNCGEGQCVCYGKTANCTGLNTTRILPAFTQDVSKIFASCYDLTNLTRDSFINIRRLNLQQLYLVHNFVYNFTKDVFSDLTSLTVLRIGENVKANLNRTALYVALGSIQKRLPVNLTVARAGIKTLNSNVLRYLKECNVSSLSFQSNKIKYINLHVLNVLTNLKTLDLSGNSLRSIKGNISMTSLLELDLNRNNLHQKGLHFCYQLNNENKPFFPNLRVLYLSNNYILAEAARFSKLWKCLEKLEFLDMSNNSMTLVNISSFSKLKSLKKLSFAFNWIQHVTPGLLPPKLEILDFYDNHLIKFPPNLCKGLKNETFPKLKALIYGRNYIQKLHENCECLPGIETLDFSRNDVTVIENGTFSKCKNLKNLNVGEMIPDEKVFHPAAFQSDSLINLDIRKNNLDFTENKHKFLFRFCPNLNRLDISYNSVEGMGLESIVDMLTPLPKLEELIMQGVDIQYFPGDVLSSLPELKILNIDDNMVHRFEFHPKYYNSSQTLKIENISLAENYVTTVTENDIAPEIFNSLKFLNLGDNQFLCDCQMEWFRDQINSSGNIGSVQLIDWPDKYLCSSPATLVGHSFNDFKPDVICKPLNPVIISLIAIGSFLVLFTLVASVLYWNRWHLRYWSYKISKRRHGGVSNDLERRPIMDQTYYDGYVVSTSDDDEFVHHPFLKLMEDQLKYKLHIWKRDAKNGAYIEVVCDAMDASRQIVVIVSNNLIKDDWCKFQVDIALDLCVERKRNCVMLVVLEDVDFKPISKSWCVLLTKTPTIYWSKDESSIKYRLFEETVKQTFGDPIHQRYSSIQ